MRVFLVCALVWCCMPATHAAAAMCTISASAANDLVAALPATAVQRVDTPAAALAAAADGSAVLILADGYPSRRTELPPDFYRRARQKRLRLYVEYPARVDGIELKESRHVTWERGVIASDFFAPALPRLRIVGPHACFFIPVAAKNAHLVIGRVAGYDTAVYGLAGESFPLLFDLDDGQVLVATTKLSQFVTARYSPGEDWKLIWRTILRTLDPSQEPPALNVTPIVRPAFSATSRAPATLERETFDRAAKFYTHARLLITRERQPEIHKLLATGIENTVLPTSDAEGDGARGMLEGYSSLINPDGSQPQRAVLRADCNAEAAMVLALTASPDDHRIAANLLDCVYGPEMQSLGRLDPKHPAFGLIAWGAISPAWQIANYGDDNARVVLATILASTAMKSDRWNEQTLRALLANLRTTGTRGFRGDRIDIAPLEQLGWKHFHDTPTVNPAPHFESGLWACYLWAYRATGEKEFLDKTRNALGMSMDAYAKKQWRWMDNIERSRILLPLAWLVRVDDTPEHRAWVMAVANDMLDAQQPCGAIQERLGGAGGGHYQIPQTNEAYGTAETPLIQRVGDPASDQLYTTGFALLGLREAAAATGDAKLKSAEDKLADFLCRIQVRSEKLPWLDGAWFRAFDYQRWDYWASNADLGWGVWSVEAGWGQAWIAATLSLRDKQTSFWEMTASATIKRQFTKVRDLMQQNAGRPWKKG